VERLGLTTAIRWFEGVLADHHYRRGEWDEARRLLDTYLTRVEEGELLYGAWQDWFIRAELRLAGGDTAGALSDAEKALELARAVEDPQAVYFALPAGAHVFTLAGERERALPLAREFIDALTHGAPLQFAAINLPLFAAAARELGLSDELLAAIADRRATPWTEEVRAYAGGDYLGAAEILRRTGSKPEEAEARLRAAEQLVPEGRRPEGDEQLQQALAFYRSVGASRYVQDCEALLAASA
jgi:tetratricopeptide (TPR) repeat protein